MGAVVRPPGRIGIVVGLPQEAAILEAVLGRAMPLLACAGANPARAAQGAAELVAGGADMLLSFGFAGGLDPALRPGDIILASHVVTGSGASDRTDESLRDSLAQAFRRRHVSFRIGTLVGVDAVLATALDKRRVREATAALAADMESHAVAAAGARRFAALRVVMDPAERAIPPAVTHAIGADGAVRVGDLLINLLSEPRSISELWRLARGYGPARTSLRHAAIAVGEAFGLS